MEKELEILQMSFNGLSKYSLYDYKAILGGRLTTRHYKDLSRQFPEGFGFASVYSLYSARDNNSGYRSVARGNISLHFEGFV